MPRLGKKTLYLDLDALDKMDAALKRLPGKPSLSSYLNEQLPTMADLLHDMVNAATQGGLGGVADLLLQGGADLKAFDNTLKAVSEDKKARVPLSDIPPKKPARKRASKKVVT